jgi:sterol desaturase/sphingolipid hydroxylase (fatty acid hydroxylase superfamily)
MFVWAIALCYLIPDLNLATLVAVISTHVILRLCENIYPYNRQWRQSVSDIWAIIAITLLGLVVIGFVTVLYDENLGSLFAITRQSFGVDLWPSRLPFIIQIFLVYFVSEFLFYWIHRAIHTFGMIWRISGHGMHHSFHNLHAINFLTAHPFEILFLLLPIQVVSFFLGAPEQALLGGSLLLTVNSAFAHANIDVRSTLLGYFFTSPEHHRLHHSMNFADSNSNYSCNAIIFDRLFGTYKAGRVEQTGIGPTEPSSWQKLMLPLQEPEDKTASPIK